MLQETAPVVQEVIFTPGSCCTVVPSMFRGCISSFPAVHAITHLETQSSKIKAHEAATLHLQGSFKLFCFCSWCQLNNLSRAQGLGSTAFDSESLWRASTRFRIGGKSVRAGEGWELLCSSCMRAKGSWFLQPISFEWLSLWNSALHQKLVSGPLSSWKPFWFCLV